MFRLSLKLISVIFILCSYSSLVGQSCADGSYSWDDDIALILAPCMGCHGSASGLSLNTYAGIQAAGNQCATDNLLTGTTLADIISSGTFSCSGGNVPSMNGFCGSCISAAELADIQAWVDGGAQESCPAVLPVEYSNLEVTANEREVSINWTTVFEINSAEFEVFHSVDLKNYVSIGKIDAYGNSSSPISYELTHKTPQYGDNYYRLVQTDLDGSSNSSKILFTRYFGLMEMSMNLYPNPAIECLNIVFQEPIREDFSVLVYNNYGHVVINQAMPGSTERIVDLYTAKLEIGHYQIIIKNESEVLYTDRFIKI